MSNPDASSFRPRKKATVCQNCNELGLAIDRQAEALTNLHREVEHQAKFIGEWKARCEKLQAMLKKSTVRLGICLARMKGCREENPGEHAISMDEIPAWMGEQQALLDEVRPPSAQETARRLVSILLDQEKASDDAKRSAKNIYEAQYGTFVHIFAESEAK